MRTGEKRHLETNAKMLLKFDDRRTSSEETGTKQQQEKEKEREREGKSS